MYNSWTVATFMPNEKLSTFGTCTTLGHPENTVPNTVFKEGVNIWDYEPDENGVVNPRFTLLTNQNLAQHYSNVGYSYQSEHLCGRAALQLYRDGQAGIAVIIPWNESGPTQLTEIHYRVCKEAQFLQAFIDFLNRD
jgi:hypothetical protein